MPSSSQPNTLRTLSWLRDRSWCLLTTFNQFSWQSSIRTRRTPTSFSIQIPRCAELNPHSFRRCTLRQRNFSPVKMSATVSLNFKSSPLRSLSDGDCAAIWTKCSIEWRKTQIFFEQQFDSEHWKCCIEYQQLFPTLISLPSVVLCVTFLSIVLCLFF